MTQEEIMAEIFGTVQIPPEADFVPRWSGRLPNRVVGLLDGITADNALPDMNRWNAVADALADSGLNKDSHRVLEAVRLWNEASRLEIPKTIRKSPAGEFADVSRSEFCGSDSRGPGLEKWRRMSLYGVLQLCLAPNKGTSRWVTGVGGERLVNPNRSVSRLALWNWGIGVGLADRSQHRKAIDAAVALYYFCHGESNRLPSTLTAAAIAVVKLSQMTDGPSWIGLSVSHSVNLALYRLKNDQSLSPDTRVTNMDSRRCTVFALRLWDLCRTGPYDGNAEVKAIRRAIYERSREYRLNT